MRRDGRSWEISSSLTDEWFHPEDHESAKNADPRGGNLLSMAFSPVFRWPCRRATKPVDDMAVLQYPPYGWLSVSKCPTDSTAGAAGHKDRFYHAQDKFWWPG